jgi:DNA-binding NarL/FixJ family response regulator
VWCEHFEASHTGNQMTIRVRVADDHPVVLAGLNALLDDGPDLEVVGEADRSLPRSNWRATCGPASLLQICRCSMWTESLSQAIGTELRDTAVAHSILVIVSTSCEPAVSTRISVIPTSTNATRSALQTDSSNVCATWAWTCS